MQLVDVANSALSKLGSIRIVALTDTSEQAKLCALQLPLIYKELLRQHSWSFALQRVALTLNATPPIFGFANAFDLPAGTLGVITVDLDSDEQWIREGNQILTDETSINAQIIVDIPDPTNWTTDFVELVAAKLAAEISYALTQSAALKTEMWNEFEEKLKLARFIDSRERSGQRVTANKWRNSRYR